MDEALHQIGVAGQIKQASHRVHLWDQLPDLQQ